MYVLILYISTFVLQTFAFGLHPPIFGTSQLNSVLDLTWDFNNNTIYWSDSQPFTYTKSIADYESGYWYASNDFKAGEHGGTHMDAPYHFNKNGWKVGDIPLNRLVAKGVLIDLSSETDLKGANATLLPKHLDKWEKLNGKFPYDSVLLVKFNWSKFWSNETQYMGFDDAGNLNFPGISKEAAEKIMKSKKFFGVGVDTASADPGSDKEYFTHRILLGGQMYLLENIKLIAELPAKGFTLIISPMKIESGSGAPLRIFAVPNHKFCL